MTTFNVSDAWEQKASDYLGREVTPDKIKKALVDAQEAKSPVATIYTTGLCRVEGTKTFEAFKEATKKGFPNIVGIEQQGQSRIKLWTERPTLVSRALDWI